MSRFHLVQAPPREPGHCWITKTAVGPFIDTGIDLSVKVIDRGRIYISVDALREMAQVAGLFDEEEPKTVGLQRKKWYDEGYNDAIKEFSNESVDRFIEHISRNSVGVAGNAAMVASEGHFTTTGAAVPEPEDATAESQPVIEESDRFEQQSAEPAVVEGSVSVPADSSNERNYRL